LQEIRNLEDEREKTLKILDPKNMQAANIQFPIDVANKPVYPKKALSLVVGLLGGLFFGFLIALSRRLVAKLKSEVGGVL
jgi:LPS O-antigen subunit length determinant protein (WzzB/FepE family)